MKQRSLPGIQALCNKRPTLKAEHLDLSHGARKGNCDRGANRHVNSRLQLPGCYESSREFRAAMTTETPSTQAGSLT